MDEQEYHLRSEALDRAVKTHGGNSHVEGVLSAADAYLAFLKGPQPEDQAASNSQDAESFLAANHRTYTARGEADLSAAGTAMSGLGADCAAPLEVSPLVLICLSQIARGGVLGGAVSLSQQDALAIVNALNGRR